METKKIHTLILGAGPSGLAAGYKLAKAGIPPVIVERNKVSGGLMRSIKRNDCSVDVGRKELYSRIPEVVELWTEILGNDYRPYSHRVGVLYDGHILESAYSVRGFRFGMPWGMFLSGCVDYLRFQAKSLTTKPDNFENARYRKNGPQFSRIFYQKFEEKFRGEKWNEMPADDDAFNYNKSFIETVKSKVKNKLNKATNTTEGAGSGTKWRHPAKGSGQITEEIEKHLLEAGTQFDFGTQASEIVTSEGRISEVHVSSESGDIIYQPQYVISSIPIEFLGPLLLKDSSEKKTEKPEVNTAPLRSTILVYLFIDEPPKFQHVWLNVTCPKMKIGRVTNYAAFNGDMVPKNQTCLCIEFFCTGEDELLDLSNDELRDIALGECESSGLIDAAKCFDHLVFKLPGAHAAVSWVDWLSESKLEILAEIKKYENLYDVNRGGTDVATYSGLMAAESILSEKRGDFDELTDPTRYPASAAW